MSTLLALVNKQTSTVTGILRHETFTGKSEEIVQVHDAMMETRGVQQTATLVGLINGIPFYTLFMTC